MCRAKQRRLRHWYWCLSTPRTQKERTRGPAVLAPDVGCHTPCHDANVSAGSIRFTQCLTRGIISCRIWSHHSSPSPFPAGWHTEQPRRLIAPSNTGSATGVGVCRRHGLKKNGPRTRGPAVRAPAVFGCRHHTPWVFPCYRLSSKWHNALACCAVASTR